MLTLTSMLTKPALPRYLQTFWYRRGHFHHLGILPKHRSQYRFLVLTLLLAFLPLIFFSLMARAFRSVLFELKPTSRAAPNSSPVQKDKVKIVLQPRVCTLRSYGSDPSIGVIKSKPDGGDAGSPFFAILSEYIESSNKSRDFENISGRLAMVVFAATVALEAATGNSIFKKTDVQGIAQAVGACFGAVAFAAVFAWFSSARGKVEPIFTLKCNTFIDSLIDQIIDGLFYESELSDWADDM